MKKTIIVSLTALLLLSSSPIEAKNNNKEVLIASFNSTTSRLTTYENKIKLNEKHLALIEDAEANLLIAEETLTRKDFDMANESVEHINYNFIKSKFQSRLGELDCQIVVLEEVKRIEEEKAKQIEEEKIVELAKKKAEETFWIASTKENEQSTQSAAVSSDNFNEPNTIITSNKSNNGLEKEKDSNEVSNSNSNPKSEGWVKVDEGTIANHARPDDMYGEGNNTYEHWSYEGDISDLDIWD